MLDQRSAQPNQMCPEQSLKSRSPGLREENLDFAYLLGAFAAHTEIGTPTAKRLSFSSRDDAQLELLIDRLSRIIETPPTPFTMHIGDKAYKRITICNEPLARHIHETTENNTRVPWEHLGSRQERVLYVRALFDHAGSFQINSSSGITLSKMNGESLLKDIGRVFLKLELYPLFIPGDMYSLKLLERSDWSRFLSEIGTSLPAASEQLTALARTPSKVTYYSVEDYEAVMSLGREGILAPSAIASRTNVPANSVRDWLTRGAKPRCVRRYHALKEHDNTMPNADSINAVYRHLGGSSQCARVCATRAATEDIRALCQGPVEKVYGDDHAILSALGV
jgi:hypothetical protein